MKVKVFEKNDNGKIEFTRKELEALLNEVFNDGFKEGKDSKTYTWTSPSWTYLNSNKSNIPYTPDYYNTTVTCLNDPDTTVKGNSITTAMDSLLKITYGNRY